MSGKFISLVLAASVAVAGLSTAPARADNNDIAKVLTGVAALAIVGAAIHQSRKDDGHVSTRGYHNSRNIYRPHPGPRAHAPRRANRQIYNNSYNRAQARIETRQELREAARRKARRDARQHRRNGHGHNGRSQHFGH